jgi:hypothetical protein
MSSSRLRRQVLTIAGKDLRLELRSRERLVSMLTFAVLVAVVFSFALDPTIRTRGIAGAMLWVTILFAGMLGLGRSFSMEREQDAMTGLLLAPIDRGALYLGKFLANLALLLMVVVVIFPVYGLFFQIASWGRGRARARGGARVRRVHGAGDAVQRHRREHPARGDAPADPADSAPAPGGDLRGGSHAAAPGGAAAGGGDVERADARRVRPDLSGGRCTLVFASVVEE